MNQKRGRVNETKWSSDCEVNDDGGNLVHGNNENDNEVNDDYDARNRNLTRLNERSRQLENEFKLQVAEIRRQLERTMNDAKDTMCGELSKMAGEFATILSSAARTATKKMNTALENIDDEIDNATRKFEEQLTITTMKSAEIMAVKTERPNEVKRSEVNIMSTTTWSDELEAESRDNEMNNTTTNLSTKNNEDPSNAKKMNRRYITCYKCGENGHMRYECANTGWKCYHCDQFTNQHISETCPGRSRIWLPGEKRIYRDNSYPRTVNLYKKDKPMRFDDDDEKVKPPKKNEVTAVERRSRRLRKVARTTAQRIAKLRRLAGKSMLICEDDPETRYLPLEMQFVYMENDTDDDDDEYDGCASYASEKLNRDDDGDDRSYAAYERQRS